MKTSPRRNLDIDKQRAANQAVLEKHMAAMDYVKEARPTSGIVVVAQPAQEVSQPASAGELVQIQNNNVVVSSRQIAEHFGKQHKDVLKAIQNLECTHNFNQRNFAPVDFVDKKGEQRPEYLITRDGFSFLAMGFTGKNAAIWKEHKHVLDSISEILKAEKSAGLKEGFVSIAPKIRGY